MSKNEFVVSVDLGASNIRVACISKNREILWLGQGETPQSGMSGIVVTDAISALIQSALGATKERGICLGIGIAAIGPQKDGCIVNPPNLPYEEIRIVEAMRAAFPHLPVHLIGDGKAAAIGEWKFGQGMGLRDFVAIWMGTGIGGGVISDGRLVLGYHGNAGEFGHILVYAPTTISDMGVKFWESVAGGRNMPSAFSEWAWTNLSTREATLTAQEIFNRDDGAAKRFLDWLGEIDAQAIIGIVHFFDPQRVVLGGAIGKNPRIFWRIKRNICRYAYLPENVEIVMSELGENAPLLGAAAIAFAGGV